MSSLEQSQARPVPSAFVCKFQNLKKLQPGPKSAFSKIACISVGDPPRTNSLTISNRLMPLCWIYFYIFGSDGRIFCIIKIAARN